MGNIYGFIGFMLQAFFKRLSYGIIKLNEGDYQAADELFKQVLKKKKLNWTIDKIARVDRALTQWKLDNLDRAIEILEAVCQEYERADSFATLAYFYILKGDYEKAGLYNEKALEEEEDHPPALDNYGQMYYRQGDYEKAKEYFQKALDKKPTLPDSLYYMGCIAAEQGRRDEALEYINKALQSPIRPLNTVTRQQIEDKLKELGEGR
ncbi:MAG: hypothetical protein PWP48_1616 [Clostridiales bacterium]|nr:hypothetical protein [Clostridiales bacterium]